MAASTSSNSASRAGPCQASPSKARRSWSAMRADSEVGRGIFRDSTPLTPALRCDRPDTFGPGREELIFTPDKLLNSQGDNPTEGRFILGFPQLSTRKSPRPQLLHKWGMFFYCGEQPSAAEWVQRKRWNLSTL